MASGDTRKVILENKDGEYLIPYTEVASSTTVGRVKPDGTSTSVDANGVISVIGKQDTISDLATIRSGAAAGATAAQPSDIGNAEIEIQKNGTKVDSFTTNQSGSKKTINITVPTSAADVSALPSSTKYGASITVSLNTTDYKLTTTLKDQDGNTLGTAQVVDFPIESVVVNGSYDSTNKKIVLTLQNGNTVDIPVADLISGLQSEITSSNKLDADLVDDSTSTNKFVTASDKTTWNGKQNALTFDTTPTSSSTNPVTSGGIYTALGDKADDSAVVKLTGNQSISGTKTFNSEIKRSAALSGGDTYVIRLVDSNSKGEISQVGYYTGNTLYNRLLTNNTTSSKHAYLDIQAKDNGESVLQFISNGMNLPLTRVTNSTTDRVIPTMGWVNNPDTSTNVVHRSGTETVTGAKTFTSDITVGSSGSCNIGVNGNIELKPSTSTSNGGFIDFHYAGSSDDYTSRIISLQNGLYVQGNNTFYLQTTAAKAPTPTEDNTTSTQIDTVGARNTKLANYQTTLVSGTNIKTINSTSLLGSGDLTIDSLPAQSGQSGKFLTTDGTNASWGTPTASAAWGNITGTLSNQTDLSNALSAKADDSTVVKLTGDQTIAGQKTFSDKTTLRSIELKNGTSANNGGYIDFHYNNDSSDYTSRIIEDASGKLRLQCTTTQAPAPTEDTTTSTQIDTVGARNTKLATKQDTLVSGTNIKTINGSSVLGSGDLTVSATAAWGGITGTLSNQTDLQNALNAKANDSDVVKLTGNQTISGTKTFSSSPIVPTPTTSDNSTKIATTAYVKAQSYQTAANLVTSVSSSSTDSQYPSAKLFYDTCGDIESLINAL